VYTDIVHSQSIVALLLERLSMALTAIRYNLQTMTHGCSLWNTHDRMESSDEAS